MLRSASFGNFGLGARGQAQLTTRVGLTRRSTRSFEMHHKQRISLAAVMADAKAIRRRLLVKKQQLFNIAAPAASAFNGSA